MKRNRSILLLLILLLGMLPTAAIAAGTPYTYTVRIYAGAQGTFADGSDVLVYDNLTLQDRISFSPRQIVMENSSKYYVKGIREAGKDNSTVAASFPVTRDQDYVVAYGVFGNAVAYTVHYVNANGQELAPSETYYGNIGDRPVVAFLYIEGYLPQAYNLTRVLTENAEKNVFSFVYSPIPTVVATASTVVTATPTPTETATAPVSGEKATATPYESATPEPTEEATPEPTEEATPVPTEEATPEPTEEAMSVPGEEATAAPNESATPTPTEEATSVPGEEATAAPNESATPAPTEETTASPAEQATATPALPATSTPVATVRATPTPTVRVTSTPNVTATPAATAAPATQTPQAPAELIDLDNPDVPLAPGGTEQPSSDDTGSMIQPWIYGLMAALLVLLIGILLLLFGRKRKKNRA